jgi:hypothetical protein
VSNIIKLTSRKERQSQKTKQSKILNLISNLADELFDDNYGIYKTNATEFQPSLTRTNNTIVIKIKLLDGVIE